MARDLCEVCKLALERHPEGLDTGELAAAFMAAKELGQTAKTLRRGLMRMLSGDADGSAQLRTDARDRESGPYVPLATAL